MGEEKSSLVYAVKTFLYTASVVALAFITFDCASTSSVRQPTNQTANVSNAPKKEAAVQKPKSEEKPIEYKPKTYEIPQSGNIVLAGKSVNPDVADFICDYNGNPTNDELERLENILKRLEKGRKTIWIPLDYFKSMDDVLFEIGSYNKGEHRALEKYLDRSNNNNKVPVERDLESAIKYYTTNPIFGLDFEANKIVSIYVRAEHKTIPIETEEK